MSTTSGNATTAGTRSAGDLGKIDLPATKWFRDHRHISAATLAQLPVATGTAYYPELNERRPSIFFQYSQGWKARTYPDKYFVASGEKTGGALKREFWNLDRVLRAQPAVVYIVEGETDLCALVEAGIPADAVLSAHGAKEKPTEGDPRDLPGYAYVQEALEAGLKRTKIFVWCGDGDAAGLLQREDMVKILGPARFNFIEWPEGIKDANQMLITDGAEALRELVQDGSLPWPVDGIFRLSELPEPSPMVLWEPGFPEWERKVMLAPRTLSVVTGHPGHGKTALWNQIWFNVVNTYQIPICSASFETRPKPHVRRQLRSLYCKKLERDLDPEMIEHADRWINERYMWLVHPDNRPTIEWLLDRAEVAVIRHGARIFTIDPWNRAEATRLPGETIEEYIGRCLRILYQFAVDMNCHVQVLAHPAKMDGHRKGTAPLLEDIAGAKHWDNMPDQGFTVHRPTLFKDGKIQTEALLLCRKARFEDLGYPCKLNLNYDRKEAKYKSVDYDIV
jgi:twinkle protein